MVQTTIRHEGELTVVTLAGSINSANAGEVGAALADEPKGAEGMVIDARALDYISSAGLRVLLAAKKRCGARLFKIINVSDGVMDVFEVTGFAEIMDISKAARCLTVEGCERIGAGACGEVFRLNDETIIKLYYPRVKKDEIEREKALAKKAFVMGVPTAISYDIVEADGRTGVVYELIRSKTLGELIREDEAHLETYVTMYAEVCRAIHAIEAAPGELPDFKGLNRDDIPNITGITDAERDALYRFLDLVPQRYNCLHGDLNINDIMVQDGECCLIDMGEFSAGTPMFDLSRILFSMEFAAPAEDEFYGFYKMPQKTVKRVLRLFLQQYFGCETLSEAEKNDPDVAWLYPLAWFRCCTSLLKGDRWGEEKRALALELLHTKLLPFIEARSGK